MKFGINEIDAENYAGYILKEVRGELDGFGIWMWTYAEADRRNEACFSGLL